MIKHLRKFSLVFSFVDEFYVHSFILQQYSGKDKDGSADGGNISKCNLES